MMTESLHPPMNFGQESLQGAAESILQTPFRGLTPDAVINAVESVGPRCDGRLLALNSFENRVYQVGVENESHGEATSYLIAKFYRPGRWADDAILEEHGFIAELERAEVPAVAPLSLNGRTLHSHRGHRFSLSPRHGGRAPELDNVEVLAQLGRFIGRLHQVGARHPFRHREVIDIEHFGDRPVSWLAQSGMIPADLMPSWQAIVTMALDGVASAFKRAGAVRQIRLHGDCHAGNVLWRDPGAHLVDFDDARTGPAIQDLWMLLSGDAAAQASQLGHVLRCYRLFADFDPRELELIEALRTLRFVHYTAWIARRWHDPAFPAAFPWFGSVRDWQDRILVLREQVAAMQEPALPMALD